MENGSDGKGPGSELEFQEKCTCRPYILSNSRVNNEGSVTNLLKHRFMVYYGTLGYFKQNKLPCRRK